MLLHVHLCTVILWMYFYLVSRQFVVDGISVGHHPGMQLGVYCLEDCSFSADCRSTVYSVDVFVGYVVSFVSEYL